MFRVIGCLTTDHDYGLVLLAIAICAIGAASVVIVANRVSGSQSRVRWLAILSLCAGAAVWSTHFIAMLAFKPGISMTYALWPTALSFIAGTAVMGLGFMLAAHGRRPTGIRRIGGAIVGGGVVLLHFVGMAAVRFHGQIQFDTDLVVVSVILATGLGAAAVSSLLGPDCRYARVRAALLFIAMTATLHFTAMGAVELTLGPAASDLNDGVSRTMLAGAVTIASLSVVLIGMAGATIDRRVSLRLAAEAERFRTLAEGAFEAILVHRGGIVVDANAAARRLFGLGNEPTGHSIAPWTGLMDDLEGRSAGEPDEAMTVETILQGNDGRRFPAEVRHRRMRLPDGGEGDLLAIRDLTQRKESEARIAHLALHDPLTDVPNRALFTEIVTKAIAYADRCGEPFALLVLDIDNFKAVNDMHGHEGGDAVIRAVARRLSGVIRTEDVVTRFGGDEFAIMQTSAGQPNQAIVLADRIQAAFQEPISLRHTDVTISVSAGVALFPADGDTLEELLRNADVALSRAKADGKATCRFFESAMNDSLKARRNLQGRLREAIAGEKLSVSYQPIVSSGDRHVIGFEALVRWTDDELGRVSPEDFIPVAEESGLIMALGDFVLNSACRAASGWPAPLRVAVNVSAVQFRREGLVDSVRNALARSGLPGDRLDLEVTETLLVKNPDEALQILHELRAMGVRISMDDFGTGYSSLSYLKRFPFDKIKIDREFVSDLTDVAGDASIVQAVILMGKSLNLRVVAEGVETELQASVLKDLDCDEMQGYLIERPMAAVDVTRYLERSAGLAGELVAASGGVPEPERAGPRALRISAPGVGIAC